VVEKTALKEAIMVVITIPRIKKESRISSRVKPSLVAGCWLLVSGRAMLDTRFWILNSGYSILDPRFWILDTGRWMLVTGFLWPYVINS
jgi:hypothetical protein